MSGRPMPDDLLERAPQLAALHGLVEQTVQGQGAGMLLLGEAGVGKTSLLDAVGTMAAQRDVRILRAQGDQLEWGLPWGLTLQLFGGLIGSPDRALLDQGPARHVRPLLEQAVLPGEPGTDALPLLHGVWWLVMNLADRAPLLLVVDDAHWADSPSLRLLCYLLRRLDGVRASMIVAARPGEAADDDIHGLLTRLVADPSVSIHRVTPLADASIRDLVRRSLPGASPAFQAAVASAVGGNPFLCHEVLAAVAASGVTADDAGARQLGDLRPAGVRSSILLRLAQLGPDAAALATALAVLGPHAGRAAGRLVAGLSREAAAAAVHRLIAAGLIDGSGPTLRFVHPILREAVLADIGDERLRHAHAVAARVLADRGSPARDVAGHLLRADPLEQPWAVDVLRAAAAEDLGRAAPGRAVKLLRAALATAGHDVRAAVLVELGRAETLVGDPAAVSRFEHARRLPAAADDPEVALLHGEALYAAGRPEDAATVYREGLQLVAARDQDEADLLIEARLLAGLESLARHGVSPDHRLRARAVALGNAPPPAPSPADRVLMASAAGRHALAGDWHRDRVVALARSALDGDLPVILGRIVLEPVIAALMICDELDQARSVLDGAVAQARARGQLTAYAGLLPLRAVCAYRQGRLADAEADASDAIGMAEELPGAPRHALAPAHAVMALTALERDDLTAAVSATSVPDADARWGGSPFYGWYLDARGRVALRRDQAAAAEAHFAAAGRVFVGAGGGGTFCGWRAGRAVALHLLGRGTEAAAVAKEAVALARRFGAPSQVAGALRTQARLADADHDRAVRLLTEADQVVRPSQARLEAARVAVALGAALRRTGQRRLARTHLRRGLDAARACWATALADRAADELAASGARRPAMAISGAAALTPSERRVARLAADGLSNRQIAESLFVSRKTVEVHLSSTYRKLDITSREQLGTVPDLRQVTGRPDQPPQVAES